MYVKPLKFLVFSIISLFEAFNVNGVCDIELCI